jgi:hypothetical protein
MDIKNSETNKETCGIIMPISGTDTYSSEHWVDVKILLEEVISDAGFIANLVSDADEIGIIHNRIVSNIYSNPIIICDVSSKNPNVMFELGLRLAFDKATIIIKDDITNYNFDTAPIEHLTYPRDLRYSTINKFKTKLKDKLISTYKASQKQDYSTFLKNFVQYKPKLEVQEISSQDFIVKQLETISKQVSDLSRTNPLQYDLDRSITAKMGLDRLEFLFVEFVKTRTYDTENIPARLLRARIVEEFQNYLSTNQNPLTKSLNSSELLHVTNELFAKYLTFIRSVARKNVVNESSKSD